jgi:predicted TIM-barrel fold metal-dependent hydrolase
MELTFFGTRALPWMIFGGVFERFPGLRLVFAEITGPWWTQVIADLESAYLLSFKNLLDHEFGQVLRDAPRPPSEYCRSNVFVGASFMSREESEAAVELGHFTNVMWGSDYPHPEGTYQIPEREDEVPVTHLALRATFAGLPDDATRRMLGDNAIDVFGLDRTKLQTVADRIGAPSLDDINEPLIGSPEGLTTMAFRTTRFI